MQLVVVAKLTSRAFVVGLVRRLVCILVGFERRCTAGVYPERQGLDLGVSRRRRRPMMLLRRLAALIIGDDNDLTTTTTITITTTTAVVMVVQRCDNDDAGSLEGGGGGGGEGEGRGIRTKRVVRKEGELSRHRHRRSAYDRPSCDWWETTTTTSWSWSSSSLLRRTRSPLLRLHLLPGGLDRGGAIPRNSAMNSLYYYLLRVYVSAQTRNLPVHTGTGIPISGTNFQYVLSFFEFHFRKFCNLPYWN